MASWYELLAERKKEYQDGVRAAFVEPELPPGPYHIFLDSDSEDAGADDLYVFSANLTLEDLRGGALRLGTVDCPESGIVMAYDPDERRLVTIGSIDGTEWTSTALSERLEHARRLAEQDLLAERPELAPKTATFTTLSTHFLPEAWLGEAQKYYVRSDITIRNMQHAYELLGSAGGPGAALEELVAPGPEVAAEDDAEQEGEEQLGGGDVLGRDH